MIKNEFTSVEFSTALIKRVLRCQQFFKKNRTAESDFILAALPYVKRPSEYKTYWKYLMAIKTEAQHQLNNSQENKNV